MYFPGLQEDNFLNKTLALYAVFALIFYPFVLSAQEATSTQESYPIIETEDAIATADIENEVNTNDIQISGDIDTQNNATSTQSEENTKEQVLVEEKSEPATTTKPLLVQEENADNTQATSTQATSTPISVDVKTESKAVVENDINTQASTGENEIIGDGGVIVTGDSYAGANVANVVNTNIYNSYGFLYLLNQFFGFDGNIDLRDFQDASNSSLSSLCSSEEECSAQLIPSLETVSSTSTADISNTVLVRSNTGENTDSTGVIATGDSYASANVVNVANTNIIDSNYLLFTLNNFGGWNGDLVFPNSDFFTNFFFGGQGVLSRADVSTDNTAQVSNSVSTAASTGENTVTNGGTIETGNALSATNIVNEINSNYVGGSTIRILIRVYGNWLGDVFNAPPGVYWRETDSGVELFGSPEEGFINGGVSNFSKLTVNATNTATITNNVQVEALTGENLLGAGDIYTGNAYASANVVNVANTNIMSQNWILAIVNIFGNWGGNISFGMPDLWVGTQVEVPDKNFFGPHEMVGYHFTIINHGDADASGVRLMTTFDKPEYISFDDGYNYSDPQKGLFGWDIGTIPAGGIVKVTYDAKVSSSIPFKETDIKATTQVTSTETDANLEDNEDFLDVVARDYVHDYDGVQVTFTPDPDLVVTKTDDVFSVTAGTTTVNYKITIKNDGGIAYHAVLVDTLKNEDGDILNEQEWELDDIYPNEKIEVTYTSIFSATTPPGVYTNYAQVKAIGRHSSLVPFYGWIADSNIATSSITYVEIPETPVITAESLEPQEDTATTTPPGVVKRTIVATNVPEPEDSVPIIETPQFYVPFSPLLYKVFAFKDSITPRIPDQKAAVFSAFNRKSIQDTYLLIMALLVSFLISEALMKKTRLRNAFTSF